MAVELLIGAGEPWNTHEKVERTREVESSDRNMNGHRLIYCVRAQPPSVAIFIYICMFYT